MRIVPLAPAHIPEAARLEALCFSLPRSEAALYAELADGQLRAFAVLDEQERFAGFASFQYVLDEGYIENVAVDPACRRRGYATALLDEMARQAQALSLAFLTLEVRAGNEAAIALYTRCGYRAVGRRKHYYERPREDAILMTKFFPTHTI